MKHCLYLFLCPLLFCGVAFGQSRSTLEDEGYDYLNNNEWAKAYEVFDKLHNRYPKELDYHFKLGICALNYSEKKERAIEIFQEIKVRHNTTESEMYLGKAYHRNYKFDEAIVILQPLLERISISKKKEEKDLIPDVKLTLQNCLNGKELMKQEYFCDIRNLGPAINTSELEGVPVITADEETMIYTYVGRKSLGGKLNAELKSDPKGNYLSDIYYTTKDENGVWQQGKPLQALNTKGNDAAIAISPDGTSLFTFLSTNENEGDIMVSRLEGDEWGPAEPLNSNINTPEYWEGSCSITSDGKYLYFSSERPTGYGGRDIYVSELIDGDWGPAQNLGPNINTEYDDDAPFIHPDGITLFFSSKGHMSMGGYDIMYSTKDSTGEWSTPQSMGFPLNTPEDDSYYVLNSKGDRGYFSSTRTGSGGMGSQDIYMVTPGILGDKPVLAMLKGTVYGDDRPVRATIEFTKQNGSAVSSYTSNNQSGKYLATLGPGSIYHIKVSAENFKSVEEDIDLQKLDSYLEQTKDFYLYSQSFAGTQKPTATKTIEQEPEEQLVTNSKPKEEIKTPEEEINTPEEEVAKVQQQEEEKAEEHQAPEEKAEEPEKESVVVTKPVEPEQKKEEVVVAKKPAAAEPPVAITEKKKKAVKSPSVTREETFAAVPEPTGPCTGAIPDLSEIKGRSLNDPKVYKLLLSKAGNYCNDRLIFTVQVGAFKNPENFKSRRIESFGSIKQQMYPDGVTRFTQNEFATLLQAEKMRQKAITKGIKDAWIVAFMDGQRYTLEDFIMLDFMAKSIN